MIINTMITIINMENMAKITFMIIMDTITGIITDMVTVTAMDMDMAITVIVMRI
jgi:hypothetical protein